MLKSFSFAIAGIMEFFLSERNARIHLVASIAVVITGFLFHLSNMEWMVITIMIMTVWIAEMINTAIEKLCNLVQPGIHEQIRVVKDIAAGAVLIASIGSIVTAAIIFIPKILS
jgi:diacylglycerol kinase